MKQSIYIFIFCIAMSLTSCNDYLDQAPDNRASLSSPKSIRELLVSAYPDQSYQVFTESMSDNVADRGAQANEIANYSPSALLSEQAYRWQDIKNVDQDSPTAYWTGAYLSIAACNHALEAIQQLGGGPEYDAVRAEAFICRAYAHFMLVNIFAEHYNPLTKESALGIPYITKPEKVVFENYQRNTIDQVYRAILADFEAGYPLLDDATYPVKSYHFTKKAAAAFATRLFLYTNKPDSVIKYANLVLRSAPQTMLRDLNGKYKSYSSSDAIATWYNRADEPANLLLIGCVSFLSRAIYNRYAFDFKLLSTIGYNNNVTGGKNDFALYGSSTYNFAYMPKYMEYFKRESINANYGLGYVMIPMFTAEEVLLNRAEAYLMQNDFNNTLSDINAYYSKRIIDYNPTNHTVNASKIENYSKIVTSIPAPFYPVSEAQLPYLKVLLDMRRSEFLHEGLRWFDIKRMHLEVKHSLLTGEDSPLVLTPDDPRRAVQIPLDAVSLGLKPNTSSNATSTNVISKLN